MNFWRVSSSTVTNIERGLKHKVWGFSPRWEGICKMIRKEDRVVIYASANHSFNVICEVTKEHFVDYDQIWPDDDYPHRIGIEPLPISQKLVGLKDARAFAKRPELGGSFMPAIARLTPEDFSIILSMMTEK